MIRMHKFQIEHTDRTTSRPNVSIVSFRCGELFLMANLRDVWMFLPIFSLFRLLHWFSVDTRAPQCSMRLMRSQCCKVKFAFDIDCGCIVALPFILLYIIFFPCSLKNSVHVVRCCCIHHFLTTIIYFTSPATITIVVIVVVVDIASFVHFL